MKLLIDSSTNYLFLSVYDGNKTKSFFREGKCDHSETMMDFLDSFLTKENIKYSDIDHILIGRGPGSYTGLRIAGVIGKVLSYSLNVKLSSFSSLDLPLASINKDGKYLSLTTAKRNAYYAKAVTIKDGNIITDLEECFAEISDLASYNDYLHLEINDKLLADADIIVKNIIDKKMYQDEDYFDYSPNYLRSVI